MADVTDLITLKKEVSTITSKATQVALITLIDFLIDVNTRIEDLEIDEGDNDE